MARFVHAEAAVETVLSSAAGRVPALRGAGGGFSLGRAVGPCDHGSGECGGHTGARVELAGDGAPVPTELEERGDDCEAGGGIRLATPGAAAGACHRYG